MEDTENKTTEVVKDTEGKTTEGKTTDTVSELIDLGGGFSLNKDQIRSALDIVEWVSPFIDSYRKKDKKAAKTAIETLISELKDPEPSKEEIEEAERILTESVEKTYNTLSVKHGKTGVDINQIKKIMKDKHISPEHAELVYYAELGKQAVNKSTTNVLSTFGKSNSENSSEEMRKNESAVDYLKRLGKL